MIDIQYVDYVVQALSKNDESFSLAFLSFLSVRNALASSTKSLKTVFWADIPA